MLGFAIEIDTTEDVVCAPRLSVAFEVMFALPIKFLEGVSTFSKMP